MFEPNKHIIQKQVLEVEMENPLDAFAFRNRLGEVMHNMLLPKMELLLDEVGKNGKVYRVDRLDIDIGTIPVENWEQVLVEKTMEELKKLLVLHNPVWPGNTVNDRKDNKAMPDGLDAASETTIPHAAFEFDSLLTHYLKTGYLPWYVAGSYKLDLHFNEWLQQRPALFLKNYIPRASADEIKRLVYFAGDAQLKQLLYFLCDEEHLAFIDFAVQAIEWLAEQAGQVFLGSGTWIKKQLYRFLFGSWSAKILPGDWLDKFSETTMTFIISQRSPGESKDQWWRHLQPPSSNPVLTKVSAPLGVSNIKNQISRKAEGIAHSPNEKVETAHSQNEAPPDTPDILKKGLKEVFVENAGLVLLHPFLGNLFEEVKLTIENKFVDEAATNKAILLSQYLVTGRMDCEDHQLTLNKILCGWPVNEPLLCDLPFTEKELFEANDLLAQVIKMWTKNGVQVNGTINGLRDAFLQRTGKLISKNKDWQLKVGQKPYDLVMSALPWGIGMTKTIWMKGMLWVEWA